MVVIPNRLGKHDDQSILDIKTNPFLMIITYISMTNWKKWIENRIIKSLYILGKWVSEMNKYKIKNATNIRIFRSHIYSIKW